jgi:chromosome segregation and condensation protein ScpB
MSVIEPLEKINELKARLEAVLFVAPVSVNLTQLATALEVSEAEVEQGLKLLTEDYKTRGLRLQRQPGRVGSPLYRGLPAAGDPASG